MGNSHCQSWKKGHLFCRNCIIENLVSQKKEKDIQNKLYMRNQQEKQAQQTEERQQEAIQKINIFEKKELSLPQSLVSQKELKYQEMDSELREKLQNIDEKVAYKNALAATREEAKQDWIKTSFWAPDNQPKAKDDEINAPSKKMKCPAVKDNNSHSIKLKELVNLKLDENENHKFVCWICKKALGHQKIVSIKKCGHVMCKECVLSYCKLDSDNHQSSKQLNDNDKFGCSVCSKTFERKDIIEMKESGSSFSSHSKVEASIQKPSFHC
eukprot:403340461